MAHEPDDAANPSGLQLPTLAIGPADIARLLRELEALEEYVQQARIRHPGTSVPLPRLSRLSEELAAHNKLSWLKSDDRRHAIEFLRHVKASAPVVHISFAADPSAAFAAKIVAWFRQNIDPLTLVRIGLQPTIAAGCIVRTTNRSFDLSIRQRLAGSKQFLVEQIRSLS